MIRDFGFVFLSACMMTVGAYGFLHDVSYWGWWLIAGLATLLVTKIEM